MVYGLRMLQNKVNKQTITIFNNNYFFIETKVGQKKIKIYVHMDIAYSYYSLDRDLNYNFITSCSRKQLIQFPQHNCMFGRNGLKLFNEQKISLKMEEGHFSILV
jgi:stage III sporulation protein SpoIIIAA